MKPSVHDTYGSFGPFVEPWSTMSSAVRILGIDPGLRRTGWGVITAQGTKLTYGDCGVVTSDGDLPLALRLRE